MLAEAGALRLRPGDWRGNGIPGGELHAPRPGSGGRNLAPGGRTLRGDGAKYSEARHRATDAWDRARIRTAAGDDREAGMGRRNHRAAPSPSQRGAPEARPEMR